MSRALHRLLYRLLPLERYLRVVSRMFFICRALGLGRRSRALEYVYHLPALVREGVPFPTNVFFSVTRRCRVWSATQGMYMPWSPCP